MQILRYSDVELTVQWWKECGGFKSITETFVKTTIIRSGNYFKGYYIKVYNLIIIDYYIWEAININ